MKPRLEELGNNARDENLQLVRSTAQLQTMLTIHDPETPEAKQEVNKLLEMLVSTRELCSTMKQAMDDTESGFRLNPFPDFH